MNAFHLTVVFITIGVVVVACLSGICSLILGKRPKDKRDTHYRERV